MRNLLLLTCLLTPSACAQPSKPPQQIVDRVVIVEPPPLLIDKPKTKVSGLSSNAAGDAYEMAFSGTRQDQIDIITNPRAKHATITRLETLNDQVRKALRPWQRRHSHPTPAERLEAQAKLEELISFVSDHK